MKLRQSAERKIQANCSPLEFPDNNIPHNNKLHKFRQSAEFQFSLPATSSDLPEKNIPNNVHQCGTHHIDKIWGC